VVAAEFALLRPVGVLIFVGIANLGPVMSIRSQLFSAARAGLQFSLYQPDNVANIKTAVFTSTNAPQTGDDALKVTVTNQCYCNGSLTAKAGSCSTTLCSSTNYRQMVQIDVSRTYTPILIFPGFPNSFDLHETATIQTK
jgi:hypothetical protein